MVTAVELLAGIVYLLMGGDLLVRGSVALARRWHLSPMLVGATVVAVGTSAPELFVSVQSALGGHAGLAIGNVVGSNVANLLLVIGSLAIVCPVESDDRTQVGDIAALLVTSAAFVLFAWSGGLVFSEGLILLAGLPLFIAHKVRHARRGLLDREAVREGRIDWVLGLPSRTWLIVVFLLVGAVWLPLGANLLIGAATVAAERLGVSEAVIGATMVAVGTSLPELATVLVAGVRRQVDIALGNVIGSNVFNVVAVMATAIVLSPGPLEVGEQFRVIDFPVMLVASLVVAFYAVRGRAIRRTTGIVAVIAYAAYAITLFVVG